MHICLRSCPHGCSSQSFSIVLVWAFILSCSDSSTTSSWFFLDSICLGLVHFLNTAGHLLKIMSGWCHRSNPTTHQPHALKMAQETLTLANAWTQRWGREFLLSLLENLDVIYAYALSQQYLFRISIFIKAKVLVLDRYRYIKITILFITQIGKKSQSEHPSKGMVNPHYQSLCGYHKEWGRYLCTKQKEYLCIHS